MNPSIPAEPLVSIIMPAYNAQRFIGEAIASVLSQTYTHWELIIADDGSRDDTAHVVAGFEDPRIHWLALPHCGVNMAVRNAALRQARGDYIAFLDADDRYVPDALLQLAGHLSSHPDCTAVYGYFKLMDADGLPQPMPWDHLQADAAGQLQIRPASVPTWESLFWHTPKQLQGLMLRRQTLARVGMFQENKAVAEDLAFYLRLFLDDFEGVHTIPAYIFWYRVYPASITQDEARFQQVLASMPALYEGIAADSRLPQPIRQQWSALCARHIGQFYARSRLQSGLCAQARRMVMAAAGYGFIRRGDWLRYCLPFAVLSYVPPSLLAALRRLKRACASGRPA